MEVRWPSITILKISVDDKMITTNSETETSSSIRENPDGCLAPIVESRFQVIVGCLIAIMPGDMRVDADKIAARRYDFNLTAE